MLNDTLLVLLTASGPGPQVTSCWRDSLRDSLTPQTIGNKTAEMRLQNAQPRGQFPSLRQQCRHTEIPVGPLSAAGTQAVPNLPQTLHCRTGLAAPSKGGSNFQETLLQGCILCWWGAAAQQQLSLI